MDKLNDKIILVTGGSQGIGLTVAKYYHEAGAKVALLARNTGALDKAVKSLGGDDRIRGIKADVTDADSLERAVGLIEEDWGPIDVFHNNAGIHRGFGPFWEMTKEEWDADINVNLNGSYYAARIIAPRMIARKEGIIINTLGGGVNNIPKFMAAYSVSKTALLKLTQIMALELEEHGVSVFGLFPGLIDTPGNREKISRDVVRKWTNLDEALEKNVQSADPAGKLSVKLATGNYNRLSGRSFNQNDDPEKAVAQA